MCVCQPEGSLCDVYTQAVSSYVCLSVYRQVLSQWTPHVFVDPVVSAVGNWTTTCFSAQDQRILILIEQKRARLTKHVNGQTVESSLKPTDCFMYRQALHKKTLRSTHTVYLCVLYGSQRKTEIISLYSVDWLVF